MVRDLIGRGTKEEDSDLSAPWESRLSFFNLLRLMVSPHLGFALANASMQEEEILHGDPSSNKSMEDFSTSNAGKESSPPKNGLPEMISYKNIVTGETYGKLELNEEEEIDIPIEYYDQRVLTFIDNGIRKSIKVDKNTLSRERGKYARLCIQFDLTKPLMAMFSIKGRHFKAEYEGLHISCLQCGKYRHTAEGYEVQVGVGANKDSGNKGVFNGRNYIESRDGTREA
ncbi:hypothetical protein KIW84_054903 [Lathyrus oleraceus]|uniref:Uncharacterized protein n=1 Tax=Pisum sativum TaxID=3888 RepID=A0A9D5AJ36_PEA|nr:hypothetical protein KIW84_054903 [Pisum sativum]